jgi:tRNA (guanine26-N2/guanine27-N2)-dimethyltransferase
MCTGCESFHVAPVGRTVVQGTSTKFKAGAGPPVDQNCNECGRPFQVFIKKFFKKMQQSD